MTDFDIPPGVSDVLAREQAANILPAVIHSCPPALRQQLTDDFEALLKRPPFKNAEDACKFYDEVSRIQQLAAGY